MADGTDLSLDAAKLLSDGDKLVRRYLAAATTVVAGTTKQLERDLEAATRTAVPGRLWRAWASEAYPRKGPARNPTGSVFVNGRTRSQGAIKFWTEPGSIRGKSDQYLAIPLPAAGPRGRGRDLSPGEWERAHGIRLRFVYRPGRASLLVADDAVLSGRSQVARPNSAVRIAKGRGSATVPIFVLVRQVPFRNAVDVKTLVQTAEGRLVEDFLTEAGKTTNAT